MTECDNLIAARKYYKLDHKAKMAVCSELTASMNERRVKNGEKTITAVQVYNSIRNRADELDGRHFGRLGLNVASASNLVDELRGLLGTYAKKNQMMPEARQLIVALTNDIDSLEMIAGEYRAFVAATVAFVSAPHREEEWNQKLLTQFRLAIDCQMGKFGADKETAAWAAFSTAPCFQTPELSNAIDLRPHPRAPPLGSVVYKLLIDQLYVVMGLTTVISAFNDDDFHSDDFDDDDEDDDEDDDSEFDDGYLATTTVVGASPAPAVSSSSKAPEVDPFESIFSRRIVRGSDSDLDIQAMSHAYYRAGAAIKCSILDVSATRHTWLLDLRALALDRLIVRKESVDPQQHEYTEWQVELGRVLDRLMFCDIGFFEQVLLPLARAIHIFSRTYLVHDAILRRDDVAQQIDEVLIEFFGASFAESCVRQVEEKDWQPGTRERGLAQPLIVGRKVIEHFAHFIVAALNGDDSEPYPSSSESE
jgi:hypothetical protein